VKAGARAVGVAESYRGTDGQGDDVDVGSEHASHSTLAAAVVRADRVVDGFAFGTCTVGGTDATEAVVGVVDALDREDVQYVLVSGVAPAWFNLLDLHAIQAAVERPVVSVSFEASPGLESALASAFEGEALERRLDTYRRQPEREQLTVNGETVFVRSVGLGREAATAVVRAFTPAGGRPEPVRVARLAARAADRLRADS